MFNNNNNNNNGKISIKATYSNNKKRIKQIIAIIYTSNVFRTKKKKIFLINKQFKKK
jgi:hypothetical protein